MQGKKREVHQKLSSPHAGLALTEVAWVQGEEEEVQQKPVWMQDDGDGEGDGAGAPQPLSPPSLQPTSPTGNGAAADFIGLDEEPGEPAVPCVQLSCLLHTVSSSPRGGSVGAGRSSAGTRCLVSLQPRSSAWVAMLVSLPPPACTGQPSWAHGLARHREGVGRFHWLGEAADLTVCCFDVETSCRVVFRCPLSSAAVCRVRFSGVSTQTGWEHCPELCAALTLSTPGSRYHARPC